MKFVSPLVEGIIRSRKGQFVMIVDIDGEEQRCHCPCTGRIGNIDVISRPCLLSEAKETTRKTKYTVEAISLNCPEDRDKSWIGINQNCANRYVEFCLKNNRLSEMIQTNNEILREQVIGNSKLDFLVDNTYIEIKTPLQNIQLPIPNYVHQKKPTPFYSIDRFCKHVTDLKNSLASHQRAIMLLVFIYDNPGFKVLTQSTSFEKIQKLTTEAFSNGVELWQANFKITPESVTLSRYFQLDFRKITM